MWKSLPWLGGAVALLALAAWSFTADPRAEPPVDAGFRPDWHVNQRWIVETSQRSDQVAHHPQDTPVPPVQWRFTIRGTERIADRDCFKIEIDCLAAEMAQPVSTLWVDRQSQALRRTATRLPVPGGFRILSESYEFGAAGAAAVLAPVPALPLDLPWFPISNDPQTRICRYQSSPVGKAAGGLQFAFEVEQQTAHGQPDQIKQLLAEPFRTKTPTIEVNLKAPHRLPVRQFWQRDLPWPAYSDNGVTVSRLIKVLPAESQP